MKRPVIIQTLIALPISLNKLKHFCAQDNNRNNNINNTDKHTTIKHLKKALCHKTKVTGSCSYNVKRKTRTVTKTCLEMCVGSV